MIDNKIFNVFSWTVIILAVGILLLVWLDVVSNKFANILIYVGIFLIIIRLILKVYLSNKNRIISEEDKI